MLELDTSSVLFGYFAIGFMAVILLFLIDGPDEMWTKLMDADPNERPFAYTKTTSKERASRDDENFDAWLGVLISFFLWPIVLVMLIVRAAIWLLIYCARRLANGIRRIVGGRANGKE